MSSPLWFSTLKMFGPYDYSGDAGSRRKTDKQVSRDYNAIKRTVSPNVLPRELVTAWNQPGRGINASSRPTSSSQSSGSEKRVPVTVDKDRGERLAAQPDDTRLHWLVEKRGRLYRILKIRRPQK